MSYRIYNTNIIGILLVTSTDFFPNINFLINISVTRPAVWASFAWGIGVTVANMFAGNWLNPVDCGAAAMLGGFPVVVVASLLTPKLPREHVDGVFACYRR